MSSNHSSSEDDSSSGDERGVRGACVMKKVRIARQTHQKISVDWNNNGTPIGDNASMLQSYIGCTTRERVPISFKEWGDVPKNIKDMIWKEVSAAFEIPKKKRWMLSSASAKWRGFKYNLKKYHMYNADGTIKEHPPKTYRFIEDRDWKAYVEIRLSKKFQGDSEYHRQLALQNKYAYRGSRKGYAKKEQELEPSVKCKLYWPNMANEVALGTMLRSPQGEQVMLHNRPLETGYVRVIVDTSIQPETSLPRPSEEVATVGDAIGVPVAWPEHLVSTNMNGISTARKPKSLQTKSSVAKSSSQNVVKKDTNRPKLAFSKLKSFHWIVRGMDPSDVITIRMPELICHNEIDMHWARNNSRYG